MVARVFVFVVFLIVLFGLQQSCIKSHNINPTISAKDIIIPTAVSKPITFPKIYYVDPLFTDHELSILRIGVKEWEYKSKGIVKIKLEKWEPPTPYNPEIYTTYPIKTVWKVYKTDAAIINLYKKNESIFAGLSFGDSILIVMEYAEKEERMKAIFIHELGHQIGLEHIKKSYPAIMNSHLGPLELTKWDMLQFCSLYECAE